MVRTQTLQVKKLVFSSLVPFSLLKILDFTVKKSKIGSDYFVYSKWDPKLSKHSWARFHTALWHLRTRSGSLFISCITTRIFPSSSSTVACLGCWNTLDFIIGHMEKSRTLRSGDRGAQGRDHHRLHPDIAISIRCYIRRPTAIR